MPTTPTPGPQPTWTLHLSGRPRLVASAEPGSPACGQVLLLRPLDAALLAVAAIEGPTPRQWLAAWLWPQVPPGAARANLRQRLRRLQLHCGGQAPLQGRQQLALAPGVRLARELPAAGPAPALPWLGRHDYRGQPRLQAWVAAQRQRWQQGRAPAQAQRAGAPPQGDEAPLSAAAVELLWLAALAGGRLSISQATQATGRNALQLLNPWLALQRLGWFGAQGPRPGPQWQAVRQALAPATTLQRGGHPRHNPPPSVADRT